MLPLALPPAVCMFVHSIVVPRVSFRGESASWQGNLPSAQPTTTTTSTTTTTVREAKRVHCAQTRPQHCTCTHWHCNAVLFKLLGARLDDFATHTQRGPGGGGGGGGGGGCGNGGIEGNQSVRL